MLCHYTAKYARIDSGYMGQLVEWPEVVTEGATIEECRAMIEDALRETILAHRDLAIDIPQGGAMFESVAAEI